ncbi:class I SAM-dependent methyltransferase [Desulfovibrio inopinatus]|uniref:class I SAM-dependent methyltransferase n=1 Tax=Desulfovibrio inopinatus TaxID=102109 RepID=UPI00041AD027|nr:class I SAM-dependent methyltransferase [Desulfovibrio inopinatus]
MGFQLTEIVPWGRSFSEYRSMFALGQSELSRSILGCGDGPASFNADFSAQGGRIVSADPLYAFSAEAIAERIDAVFQTVMKQIRANRTDYIWTHIRSEDELGEIRMQAMRRFLEDYPAGIHEGRYVNAALPNLPFENGTFDLALVSHLLFLYSKHMDFDFHLAALIELCRVAREVRIFPLVELDGTPSRHLENIIGALTHNGMTSRKVRTDYEFQRGGHDMLVITNTETAS